MGRSRNVAADMVPAPSREGVWRPQIMNMKAHEWACCTAVAIPMALGFLAWWFNLVVP